MKAVVSNKPKALFLLNNSTAKEELP